MVLNMKTIRELVNTIGIYGAKTAGQMKDSSGEYQKFSFYEYQNNAKHLAAYFERVKHLKKGEPIVIYSENRPEWMMAYFGIVYNGYWAVPLDARLSDLEVKNLIQDCSAKIMVLSSSQYETICNEPEILHQIHEFIVLDNNKELAHENKKIKLFHTVLDEGKAQVSKFKPNDLSEEDVASLIYTSGTTGNPKGVLLTHKNFSHQFINLPKAVPIGSEDTILSLLPLHHTFEFSVELTCFFTGASITYAESFKPNKMLANVRETGVTIMVGVPLIFEKIYEGIMRTVRNLPIVVKQLVMGLYYLTSGLNKVTNNQTGKATFKFLREKASLSSVLYVISGAAPLNYKVAKGFETLGITLVNGYGLTETSPVLSVNPPYGKIKNDTVGLLIPEVEVIIEQQDDIGNGEILARGPNIMKGYYKNKKTTDEVIDADGWLHTGDIGKLDSEGYLHITGRKKNIIVTPGGKNVYPEEIEELLTNSPFILEALVLGVAEAEHSKGEHIVALIVPNFEYFDTFGSLNALKITEEFINSTIDKHVRDVNQELADYKKIRNWQIRQEEFPKTSTRKIKRYLFTGKDFLTT